jgi:hypothetical protein
LGRFLAGLLPVGVRGTKLEGEESYVSIADWFATHHSVLATFYL